MKKTVIIITALLLVLSLTGCGKKTVVVCTMDQDHMVSANTLEANGDKVTKLSYDNTVYLSKVGMDQAAMQAEVDNIYEAYTTTKGVSYSYDFSDDVFHETMTIDLTQTKMADLKQLGIMENSDEKASSISLKMTLANMESAGYTCK